MALARTHLLYCARKVFQQEMALLSKAIATIEAFDAGAVPDANDMDTTYKVCSNQYLRVKIVAQVHAEMAAIAAEEEARRLAEEAAAAAAAENEVP